jgi:hypothetical protein
MQSSAERQENSAPSNAESQENHQSDMEPGRRYPAVELLALRNAENSHWTGETDTKDLLSVKALGVLDNQKAIGEIVDLRPADPNHHIGETNIETSSGANLVEKGNTAPLDADHVAATLENKDQHSDGKPANDNIVTGPADTKHPIGEANKRVHKELTRADESVASTTENPFEKQSRQSTDATSVEHNENLDIDVGEVAAGKKKKKKSSGKNKKAAPTGFEGELPCSTISLFH